MAKIHLGELQPTIGFWGSASSTSTSPLDVTTWRDGYNNPGSVTMVAYPTEKQDKIDADHKLDYNLISGAPEVNNPLITLTQNNVTKGSFTLNQTSGTTINFDAAVYSGYSFLAISALPQNPDPNTIYFITGYTNYE